MGVSERTWEMITAAEERSDWGSVIALCRSAIGDGPNSADEEELLVLRMKLADALLKRTSSIAKSEVEGITLYQELLATQERGTAQWVEVQMNLACAYGELLEGDRGRNLMIAAQHWEAALEGVSRDNDPILWASVSAEAGHCCMGTDKGNRRENLERALAHFANALSVFQRAVHPQEWEEISNAFVRVQAELSGGGSSP